MEERKQKRHRVKCDPVYFQRLEDGTKTAEIRLNDRDYQTGDILEVDEYDRKTKQYTRGETDRLYFDITHVLADSTFLRPGYVLLSLRDRLKYGSK